MKRKPWIIYAAGILLTEFVVFIAGMLTREGTRIYSTTISKPFLSPPPLAFPIAWTILYALMGIGAAKAYLAADSKPRTMGLRAFCIQLAFNFVWSFIFFSFRAFGAAFFWLLALLALVIWMALNFRKADKMAAILQVPYLLWLIFAGYLNLGVWVLN